MYYTFSIYDSDPDATGIHPWPTYTDATAEGECLEDVSAHVRDVLEIEAAGLSEADGYEIGQRIYALIWDQDGQATKLSHELTAEELG